MTRHRREPRHVRLAIDIARRQAAPRSRLGDLQSTWSIALGPDVSSRSRPVAEEDGVVEVACSSSIWVHELTLMAGDIVARLNELLAEPWVRGIAPRLDI